MRRWFIALLIIASIGGIAASPMPQSSALFQNPQVQYTFGESALFEVQLQPGAAVKEIILTIEPVGREALSASLPVPENGLSSQYSLDLKSVNLYPFSEVQYRYQAKLDNGETQTSSPLSFQYADNRFEWQRLDSNGFSVYWYDGDLSFGQSAVNAAAAGLERTRSLLPVDQPDSIQIYIYSSPAELQTALGSGTATWAAGHASAAANVALLSVMPGPDQQMELERQAPHEVMHLIQRQALQQNPSNLPAWFAEGLASLAELYPNPEYRRVLDLALQHDQLISIEDLCSRFPAEESSAYLAYAESASFLRFLFQDIGSSGLQNLLAAYDNGMSCTAGVESALGAPLSEWEARWRRAETSTPEDEPMSTELGPYLIVSLLVLVPPIIVPISYRRLRR